MSDSVNLDRNRWYQIHNTGNNGQFFIGTYLIYNNGTIGGTFIQNEKDNSPEQIWQFFPVNDSYVLRTLAGGPNSYLSTYLNPNETRIGSTSLRMSNITLFSPEEVDGGAGNSSIFWNVGFFKNSDVYLYNRLNGSEWRLLIKGDGFGVMDRNQDGPDGQRFNLTRASAINDDRYSSAILPTAGGQETVTGTAQPSSSETGSADTRGGLSTGAQAGIGVGVGLAGLAAILLGVWFFSRRRKRIQRTPIPQHDEHEPMATAYKKYAHEGPIGQYAELGGHTSFPTEMASNDGAYKVNNAPVELAGEPNR